MGHYLTAGDVRKRFVEPLAQLSGDFAKLCQQWEDAEAKGQIARPDLLLNDVLPEAALARLRKLLRETSGKLEDALGRRLSLPERGGQAVAPPQTRETAQVAPASSRERALYWRT